MSDEYLVLHPGTTGFPSRLAVGGDENPLYSGAATRRDITPGTKIVQVSFALGVDMPRFRVYEVASEVLVGGRDFLHKLEYFIDSRGSDRLLMELGMRPWGRVADSELLAWSAYCVGVVDTPENRTAALNALRHADKAERMSLHVPPLRALRLR